MHGILSSVCSTIRYLCVVQKKLERTEAALAEAGSARQRVKQAATQDIGQFAVEVRDLRFAKNRADSGQATALEANRRQAEDLEETKADLEQIQRLYNQASNIVNREPKEVVSTLFKPSCLLSSFFFQLSIM